MNLNNFAANFFVVLSWLFFAGNLSIAAIPVGEVVITPTVTGGPFDVNTDLPVIIDCDNVRTSYTVKVGQTIRLPNVALGALCSASVQLPQSSAGFQWAHADQLSPPFDAKQQYLLTDTLVLSGDIRLLKTSNLTVTKQVVGLSDLPGTKYGISVGCQFNSRLLSRATYSYPDRQVVAGQSITYGPVPEGATCSISEGNFPLPPSGAEWLPATVSSGKTLIMPNTDFNVTLTNTLV
jgi:Domain of unknown function (DUF5979)